MMRCPYCGAKTEPPRCSKCKAAVHEQKKQNPKSEPKKEG